MCRSLPSRCSHILNYLTRVALLKGSDLSLLQYAVTVYLTLSLVLLLHCDLYRNLHWNRSPLHQSQFLSVTLRLAPRLGPHIELSVETSNTAVLLYVTSSYKMSSNTAAGKCRQTAAARKAATLFEENRGPSEESYEKVDDPKFDADEAAGTQLQEDIAQDCS